MRIPLQAHSFSHFRFVGKLIGFLSGFLITGNIIGALLACLMGHFLFDYKNDMINTGADILEDYPYPNKPDTFTVILKICIYILQDKKKISLNDITLIKAFFIEQFHFDINEIILIEKKILYIIENKTSIQLKECSSIINNYCTYQEKSCIIRLLFSLVSQNLEINQTEIEKIAQIGEFFSIQAHDYLKIKNEFFDTDIEYYNTLKIQSGASIGEIKKAYRRLAILYHPDKAKDNYNKEEFQKITSAYNYLVKKCSEK